MCNPNARGSTSNLKKRGEGSDRRQQAPPSVVVAISRYFVPSFTFFPMFVSFMSPLYLLQVVSNPPSENRYNAPRLSLSFPIPPQQFWPISPYTSSIPLSSNVSRCFVFFLHICTTAVIFFIISQICFLVLLLRIASLNH
jgi:hypothetical protein